MTVVLIFILKKLGQWVLLEQVVFKFFFLNQKIDLHNFTLFLNFFYYENITNNSLKNELQLMKGGKAKYKLRFRFL